VQVDIVRSETGLVTLRTEKQTLFVLFSALIGSVYGFYEIVEWAMGFIEEKYTYVKKTIKSRSKFRKMLLAIHLLDSFFDEEEDSISLEKGISRKRAKSNSDNFIQKHTTTKTLRNLLESEDNRV